MTDAPAELCDGTVYESVSSWSVRCKRSVTPSRMADDGWKSVKYDGVLLDKIKKQATAGAPSGEAAPAAAEAAPPYARAVRRGREHSYGI